MQIGPGVVTPWYRFEKALAYERWGFITGFHLSALDYWEISEGRIRGMHPSYSPFYISTSIKSELSLLRTKTVALKLSEPQRLHPKE